MISLVGLLACVALVWSQDPLLVRWNDSTYIDDSTDLGRIIYHDEIVRRDGSGGTSADGPGILICRDAELDPLAGWRRPDGTVVPTEDNDNDFTQFRSVFSTNTRVQLARARDPLQDGASNNGLWTCHGRGRPHLRHVPLYNRGSGAIVIDSVSLGDSPSFTSTSPRFTLIADTSGGPPTTFSWRNDAGTISNGGSNSISIEVNPNNDTTGRMNCHYRSTLEVTAVAPGTYTYVASNRAASGDTRMSFVVEGGDPYNLEVIQTGINMVELTWDPPPGPPARGYHVQYGNIITSTTNTSLAINTMSNMLSLGENSFQVRSLSDHFPDGIVGPETIVVRRVYAPTITLSELTATSVRVSWSSPPMFSFTVMRYEATLFRLTDCSSVDDRRGPRNQLATDMTELFEELGEYINYTALVRPFFQSSFTVSPVITEMEFTTPAIAPSEVSSNVVPTTTSRTISVSWDAIDCSNENGPNFHYEVDFQRMDGGSVPVGTVDNVMFTVEGLQPFTVYTFRVRGVNDAGNGDYTSLMTIETNAEAPSEVPGNVMVLTVTSRAVNVSWDAIESSNQNGPNFRYKVDFQRLDGGPVLDGTLSNTQFTVNGLVPFTNYAFRVRGVNDAGNGTYTLPTMIQTNQEAPSEVPSNVVAVMTSRTITVTWDAINPNGQNFRYEVEFQRMDKGNTATGSVNNTARSFSVNGLQPFTNYTFRVRGVNGVGSGNFTELMVIQTGQEAPSEIPGNVVQVVTSRTITVSWDAINPNGMNFQYEVEFQKVDGGPAPNGAVNNVMRTLFVDGLQPFTNYTFRVRGVNNIGNGSYTELMVILSGQEAPSEVPSNVVFNVTSRTVSVSWNPIERENQNGENFRYDLELVQMVLTTSNATTQNMFTYEGLQPFTNYTFRLRGVNDAGNGNYTNPVVIQTDEDIPGGVSDLEALLSTFTAVVVTWNLPQEPNGIIILYELAYLLNETISMSENITNRLNYTIESVVNTRIEVRVRAYTSVGPGPTVTASITLLPPIVENVQVESLTATAVRVSWDRINDIPGITEYIVYYAPVSSSRKRQDNEQRVTVPSTENSTEISGLESTVEYQYQVTAVAMFGGRRLEGDRSPVTDNTRLMIVKPPTMSTTQDSTSDLNPEDGGGESTDCQCESCQEYLSVAVSVSVVVSVLLTIILYSALLLVGYYIARAYKNKTSKKITTDTSVMAMKENAAYGPVTSSQQPQDYVYDQTDVKPESEYDVVK